MANQPELTLAIDACPALANPAVARCFQAWKQAWEATRPGKESDYFAEKAGAKAYRSALPALSGVANLTACASPAMPAGPYLAYAQGATGSACPGGLTGVTTAGITFDSPTGYQNSSGGSFLLVQLISSDDLQWTSSGGPGGENSTPGLDSTYPYGGPPTSDNPLVYLPSTYTTVSRNFTANLFLMWQSSTAKSIPVPLGYQTWGFSGTATCASSCGAAGNWKATNTVGTTPGPAAAGFVPSSPSQTIDLGNNPLVDGFPTWAAISN